MIETYEKYLAISLVAYSILLLLIGAYSYYKDKKYFDLLSLISSVVFSTTVYFFTGPYIEIEGLSDLLNILFFVTFLCSCLFVFILSVGLFVEGLNIVGKRISRGYKISSFLPLLPYTIIIYFIYRALN